MNDRSNVAVTDREKAEMLVNSFVAHTLPAIKNTLFRREEEAERKPKLTTWGH